MDFFGSEWFDMADYGVNCSYMIRGYASSGEKDEIMLLSNSEEREMSSLQGYNITGPTFMMNRHPS